MSQRQPRKKIRRNPSDSSAKTVDRYPAARASPPSEQQHDEPPNAKPRQNRSLTVLEKLRSRAFRLAPNLFDSPWHDEAYRLKREKESNKETRIDVAERLRVAAIWGVEVFGPSESEQLYLALKRLGWSAGIGSARDEALTWVRQQRTYGQGGWYNVGIVDREDAPKRPGRTNRGQLPDGVDFLIVNLFQITPALTCVVVCFSLDDSRTGAYERELNLDRRTRMEGQGGHLWELSPYHLKERAIKATRKKLRESVRSWFQEHLPGHFSTSVLPARFPIGELLTTESSDVFAEKKEPDRSRKWRRLIADPWPPEIWSSEELQALRFTMQLSGWRKGEDENLILANVVAGRLSEKTISMYGQAPGSIAFMAQEEMGGTLACFGIEAFIAEVAKDVKATREALGLSQGKQGTLRTIEHVRRFFHRNAGVPAIVRELRDMTARLKALDHYAGKFTAPAWSPDGSPRSFASELREGMHHRTDQLLAEESAMREHFGQLTTILSTRESIRAQRRMEILTIAAVVVAVASLAAALPDSWIDRAAQLLASFLR